MSAGLWAHPVHALARFLGGLGLGIESAWYLLSAASLALSLPLLGAALRALGLGARLSLVVSLLTVTGPLIWAHGRLPSDYGFGVFGAALALLAVGVPSDDSASGRRGYGIRLGLTVVLGVLLHPSNVLLAAPLALAAWERGREAALVPVAVAAAAGLYLRSLAGEASAGFLLGGGLEQLAAVGALGLILPFAMTGPEEESPPPAWLWMWFGAGVLTARPLVAVAVAAIAAGTLTKFARPDNALKVALGLGVLQVAASFGASRLLPITDATGLASAQPGLFHSGAVVVVPTEEALRSEAAYLLRRRFGVPVIPWSEVPRDSENGHMIALEGAAGETAPAQLDSQPNRLPWTLSASTGALRLSGSDSEASAE